MNWCACTSTRVCTGLSLPGSSLPGERHRLHLENDFSLLGPCFKAGLFNTSHFKPSVLTRLPICDKNLINNRHGCVVRHFCILHVSFCHLAVVMPARPGWSSLVKKAAQDFSQQSNS